jgi:hypothetical protein
MSTNTATATATNTTATAADMTANATTKNANITTAACRRTAPRRPSGASQNSRLLGHPAFRPFLHGRLLTKTGRGDGSASRYGTRRAFI